MRIVSLLPSSTEILYELGLGKDLVAVSHDCDYPPDVANKIRLTSIDIDPATASSKALNEWISGKVHNGLSVYHIEKNALKEANPDLILTQELCEVCAPSFTEVKSACKILDGERKIVSLEPTSIEQILDSILTIGRVTGRTEKAEQLISALRSRIGQVQEMVTKARTHPEIGCLEWLDPVFSAGHWVPEMIVKAGGVDRLARPSKPSVRIEWKHVLDYDPEILILMPCGFNLERTIQESRTLKTHAGWENLRAVKNHQVFAVNGTAYFNRPGPRIVDGLEIMAEILHPDIVKGIAPANSYARLNF
jgi:iron complex transport system substrate-binding protein